MSLIACLLILHFVADFLLQSREMGKKKSEDLRYLRDHLGIITVVFLWPAILGFVPWWFPFANAAIHGVIDWNIWRIYKLSVYKRLKTEADQFTTSSQEEKNRWMALSGENWQYWEDHWFYSTIGFDQLLHALTIVLLVALI